MATAMEAGQAVAWLSAAGAAVVIVHVAWPVGGDFVFDGTLAAMGLVAMAASLRRARSNERRAWRALAGAGAAMAFTYVVTGYHQFTRHEHAPVPSLADLGRLGFLVFMIVFLMALLPRRGSWRDVLDGCIVAIALALVGSLTPLGLLFATGNPPLGARLALLGRALADILLVTLALLVVLRTPRKALLPALLLLVGLMLLAWSDAAITVQRLQAGYERGLAVEATRFLGFSCLLLIPLLPPGIRRVQAVESGLPTVLLPTGLAVGATAVVGYTTIGPPVWSPTQTALGIALVGFMVTRMTATGMVDLRLRRERAEALARLHEVEAQRSIMLRAISHEIQNPLTPVKLHAQMLAKQVPEARASTDVIVQKVEQVSRLARDLNLIARRETDSFPLDVHSTDLDVLVDQVIEAEAPDAARRGVRLHATRRSVPITADPERMRQVIGNLVRNAIKFTPAGGAVEIRIEVQDRVRVEITDSGRGLEPDEIRQLFTPFVQVHDRSDQPSQDRGSGLGLYISKRLVEAHGGTIGVASEGLGKGSTFWFELPR